MLGVPCVPCAGERVQANRDAIQPSRLEAGSHVAQPQAVCREADLHNLGNGFAASHQVDQFISGERRLAIASDSDLHLGSRRGCDHALQSADEDAVGNGHETIMGEVVMMAPHACKVTNPPAHSTACTRRLVESKTQLHR